MSSFKRVFCFMVAYLAVSKEGDTVNTIKRITSAGDDDTLNCYPSYIYPDVNWSRLLHEGSSQNQNISHITYTNHDSITYYGIFEDQERVTSRYSSHTGDLFSFSLTVRNMTVADSATYSCDGYTQGHRQMQQQQRYDIRVIGCSCSVVQQQVIDFDRKDIECSLDGYVNPSVIRVRLDIMATKIDGTVNGSRLTFATNATLESDLTVSVRNLLTEYAGNVSCVVPALLSVATTIERTTPFISTGSSSLLTSKPTGQSLPTSSRTSPSMTSLFASERTNQIATGKRESGSTRIVIAICVVGFLVILLMVIAVVFLRLRHKREREQRIPDSSHPGAPEHAMGVHQGKQAYEDLGRSSLVSDGMVENDLYDSNCFMSGPLIIASMTEGLTVSSAASGGMVENKLYDANFISGPKPREASMNEDSCPLYTMPDNRRNLSAVM